MPSLKENSIKIYHLAKNLKNELAAAFKDASPEQFEKYLDFITRLYNFFRSDNCLPDTTGLDPKIAGYINTLINNIGRSSPASYPAMHTHPPLETPQNNALLKLTQGPDGAYELTTFTPP